METPFYYTEGKYILAPGLSKIDYFEPEVAKTFYESRANAVEYLEKLQFELLYYLNMQPSESARKTPSELFRWYNMLVERKEKEAEQRLKK